MTFPLMFEVDKFKQKLLESDAYQTKPEIAASMIRKLQAMGFKFKLVLADSLYGESDSNFLSVLNQLQLDFVVAIRSNHGVWLPQGQKVRHNRWRPYERIFSDGKTEKRYIQEIIFWPASSNSVLAGDYRPKNATAEFNLVDYDQSSGN